MEIHWGTFSLAMDKTAALMLTLLPVVIVMQLPLAARIMRKATIWLKLRREKERKRLYGDR